MNNNERNKNDNNISTWLKIRRKLYWYRKEKSESRRHIKETNLDARDRQTTVNR